RGIAALEALLQPALQQQIELESTAAAVPGEARAGSARRIAGHRAPSVLALGEHLLDRTDGLGRIQVLRARLGAVHDGVAAIQPERILQRVEPLAERLIATVHDPAI